MAGADGQFTMIIPSHDFVVVRLGHRGSREGTQTLRESLGILLEALQTKNESQAAASR
jgi:hypothetical protein